MKRVFAVFLVLCLILAFSGCQQPSGQICRVVVRMEISGQHQDVRFTKNYTDSQTMEAVLHCLRIMPSRNKAKPTMQSASRNYFVITLHLSDGDAHTYILAAHRFFKAPTAPWVETNPEIASKFYNILRDT